MGLIQALRPRMFLNRLRAAGLATARDTGPLRRALLRGRRVDGEALRASDAALRTFVRERAHAQYHVCGTCRMGEADDPAAVVDPQGRVHGVAGLRVGDASIFPTVPRANTHLPVLMAAEKIADGFWAR